MTASTKTKVSTKSILRSSDSSKCNKSMGIRSLKDPASKLRFCQRPADSCQYHR